MFSWFKENPNKDYNNTDKSKSSENCATFLKILVTSVAIPSFAFSIYLLTTLFDNKEDYSLSLHIM